MAIKKEVAKKMERARCPACKGFPGDTKHGLCLECDRRSRVVGEGRTPSMSLDESMPLANKLKNPEFAKKWHADEDTKRKVWSEHYNKHYKK